MGITSSANIPDILTGFVKTDGDKIVSVKHIQWIKKMDECMELCTTSKMCFTRGPFKNTHSVCKSVNPRSYKQLEYVYSYTDAEDKDMVINTVLLNKDIKINKRVL